VDEMTEAEFECFCDLAVITDFIHSLSASLSLPSAKPRTGENYASKSKNLAAELYTMKTEVDLSAFVIPIDNLLEPTMACGALTALEQFIVEKKGTKMGILYQDLIDSSIAEVLERYEHKKIEIEKQTKLQTSPLIEIWFPTRKSPEPEIVELPKVFKVKQATFEVFSTLSSKSESHGSITWAAFEAAMADLNFPVVPKTGSVFTFFPPDDMGFERSFTLYRPHKSRIEGHVLLIFASRLRRVYGWESRSFEVM
jgi:hypothetical protein